jgi:hypothetical protein
MPITAFPPHEAALPTGLLGIGGDLSFFSTDSTFHEAFAER